jgi:hypothetical protein
VGLFQAVVLRRWKPFQTPNLERSRLKAGTREGRALIWLRKIEIVPPRSNEGVPMLLAPVRPFQAPELGTGPAQGRDKRRRADFIEENRVCSAKMEVSFYLLPHGFMMALIEGPHPGTLRATRMAISTEVMQRSPRQTRGRRTEGRHGRRIGTAP